MSGAVSGGVTSGGGQIAGLGVNNPNLPGQAEPGVDLRKKRNPILFKDIGRRKKPVTESLTEEIFAGNVVFTVDPDTFHACRMGKRKYARWIKYVGDGEIGKRIKAFGYKYPSKPIILKNRNNGAMLFLRYGSGI